MTIYCCILYETTNLPFATNFCIISNLNQNLDPFSHSLKSLFFAAYHGKSFKNTLQKKCIKMVNGKYLPCQTYVNDITSLVA